MKELNEFLLTGYPQNKPIINKTSSGTAYAIFKVKTFINNKPAVITGVCIHDLVNEIKPYLNTNTHLFLRGQLGQSKNGIQLAVTSFLPLSQKNINANQSSTTAKPTKQQISNSSNVNSSMSQPANKSVASSSASSSTAQAQNNTPNSSSSNPFTPGQGQVPRSNSSDSDELPF